MRNDVLERFKQELSQSSAHTLSSRTYYARKFLDFAGDDLSTWNKETVRSFIRQLESEGYASGTIRMIYGVCKRTFDAAKAVHEAERTRLIRQVDPNDPRAVATVLQAIALPGPSWDLGKRSSPRVSEEVKPAASFEEIEAMVKAVRGNSGPEEVYLALSSIYGLRRQELCLVRKEDIDFDKQTIFVKTIKGGERRDQLLCPEIIPILQTYDFKNYSVFQMSALYRRICAAAQVEVPDGCGWHAVRRLLDTELVKRFGKLDTHIFFRWKLSSSSLMEERYFTEDPLAVDRRVLSNGHPFVPLWGASSG